MMFLVLASLVTLVAAKNELYMGYKVYNVKLTTQEQQDNFHRLKSDIIDYWIKPNLKYDITGKAMVPPSQFNWFEERLEEFGIQRDVAIEDVYEYLLQKEPKRNVRYEDDTEIGGLNKNSDGNVKTDVNQDNIEIDETILNDDSEEIKETQETNENNNTNENEEANNTNENEDTNEFYETIETEESEEIDGPVFSYDDYYRYNEILNHIYTLKSANENSPTVLVDIVEFGTTDLNRPLVYIKVSSRNIEATKPIIVIEAGINPREWITIPSALNIVDKILEDNQIRYLDYFDWIVIPVVNPDGYEYTHTDLRFWEKNLSTKSNFGFICPGVNINRNFDIDWAHSDSSSSPCSHLYAGEDVSSEIETRLIQSIIDTYNNRISLYISLHNGGGFVSYPWNYEFAASGMFRQNHLLGMEMLATIQDDYSLDVASVAIGHRTSGTSSDYARINGVLYPFNINILTRGTDGVIVPESEIVDIVEDIWRAVAVAADYLMQ